MTRSGGGGLTSAGSMSREKDGTGEHFRGLAAVLDVDTF